MPKTVEYRYHSLEVPTVAEIQEKYPDLPKPFAQAIYASFDGGSEVNVQRLIGNIQRAVNDYERMKNAPSV